MQGKSHHRTYYYVVTHYGSRMVVIGPKDSEHEANEFGYQKLDTAFKVVGLDTKDRSRATAILKARKLDDTGNLGAALQRVGHQPPRKPRSGGEAAPEPVPVTTPAEGNW